MIPLSADSKIEHVDKNGNKFFFRYLIGEYQDKFMEAQRKVAAVSIPYMEKARRLVNQEQKNSGKKANEEKITLLVNKRALMLAEADGKSIEQFQYTNELIDIFLCGWEGKGFPVFPKDNKPSRCFKISDKQELMVALEKHMSELIGIDTEDQKN